MDAYDISDKIKKAKSKRKVVVMVNTEYGYREVVGVEIIDDKIILNLEQE
jgi:hypothetical protein